MKTVEIGKGKIIWVEEKRAWILPGGVFETRQRRVRQYARVIDRMISQKSNAGRGV